MRGGHLARTVENKAAKTPMSRNIFFPRMNVMIEKEGKRQ
jgi:hypothetical protein